MICTTLRMTARLLLGICLLVPCGLAAQATTTTTSHLQGTVFSGTPNGPFYAPGAKVALYGDTGIFSTVADQNGKFVFANDLPPGIYFIEASGLGVYAARDVEMHAGAVVQVSLDLDSPDPRSSAKP
jgi:hypothetical protein